jgi:hypothetical protein
MELTGGPHLAVTEGEGVVVGLRSVKKETYFGQYTTAAQAGMGRARARPAGEKAGGRLGWEAGRAGWPLGRLGRKWRKILFQIKIGFLNLSRLWKFVERDLGGILAWGFFLNSSRLLMDFRKIKYAMPCNAMHPIQDLFLESFSYELQFDNAFLYALLFAQNFFILVKSGCYTLKLSRLRFIGCATKPTEEGWHKTRIEI